MPVTLAVANHPAESWKVDKADTDEKLLKTACPKANFDTSKELLESSFSRSFLQENHVSASANGFVLSAYIAYNKHHHLTIRPEDVWLAIISQFGFFMQKNAENLRHLFVSHEGQKELQILDPTGSRGFGELSQLMANIICSDIKDPKLLKWVMPSFSTTTSTDCAVASVLLMGATQRYYSFGIELACGLPSVTLAGEIADWEEILSRIDQLYQFGDEPSQFADMLRPILRHMILSFTQPTSKEVIHFWDTIATERPRGSGGGKSISGWIAAFCFWDEEGYANMPWIVVLDGVKYPTVSTNYIPGGSAAVPVKVMIDGKSVECKMVAGSVGIHASSPEKDQREETSHTSSRYNGRFQNVSQSTLRAIQPVSGWWIFRNKAAGDAETSEEQTSQQALDNQV